MSNMACDAASPNRKDSWGSCDEAEFDSSESSYICEGLDDAERRVAELAERRGNDDDARRS